MPQSSLQVTASAITNGTGEGPEANALRAFTFGRFPTYVDVARLQSLTGVTPLSYALSSTLQYGITHARKAVFAGQEGATPLNVFVRALQDFTVVIPPPPHA